MRIATHTGAAGGKVRLREPEDPYDGMPCTQGCHKWSVQAPEGWVAAEQWRPATRRSGPEESDRVPVADDFEDGQEFGPGEDYEAREVRVTAASGAVKADGGKRRLDLLPVDPVLDVADVLTFGANKYEDRNWEKGFPYGRPYAAAMRHLMAWWKGETNDPETGLNHLAHAATNILFLLEYSHTGAGEDDRPREKP